MVSFLHSKWLVFGCWMFSGAITAALKTPDLVPAWLVPYAMSAAGALVTLPVRLGAVAKEGQS